MSKSFTLPKGGGKIKEILLIGGLAMILLVVSWRVFRGDESAEVSHSVSESEAKVAGILQQIDGVGEASVVVCERDGEVAGVVVVCEGANNLQVIMDIREAVAAALGTEEKQVKIYLKKE